MSFSRGVADFFAGCRLVLGRPKLWKWLVAPLVVTLFGMIALIWWVQRWANRFVDWLIGQLPDVLSFLSTPLEAVAFLLLLLAAYLLFVTVASAIAAPFCELLSEALEAELAGSEPQPFAPAAFVRELARGLAHAARRLVVSLSAAVGLFLLGTLVPVAGTALAFVIGLFVMASGASYDCYDAVWARHQWTYGQKRQYLASHRGRTLGLGAVVAALLAVPVVNLFALAFGAAGATVGYLAESARPNS